MLSFYRTRSDFKSMKVRVNLNKLPAEAEVKAESSNLLKTVDEERKHVIQTTIVRCVYAGFNVIGLTSSMQPHESTKDA